MKPTRCTKFSNLFWNKTLHVSDSSSVHHREFFTVNTAMMYIIQVCWQLASRIRTELEFRPDPARKVSANLYDIYHCCVYSEKTPDDRQRNCPKHEEFYSKNKFEKLVHLVGFIIRMTYIHSNALFFFFSADDITFHWDPSSPYWTSPSQPCFFNSLSSF